MERTRLYEVYDILDHGWVPNYQERNIVFKFQVLWSDGTISWIKKKDIGNMRDIIQIYLGRLLEAIREDEAFEIIKELTH